MHGVLARAETTNSRTVKRLHGTATTVVRLDEQSPSCRVSHTQQTMAPNQMVLWQPQQQASPKKAAKNKKNANRKKNQLLAVRLHSNGVPQPAFKSVQLPPTAKGITYRTAVPQFIAGSAGACRIVHREYLNECRPTTTFPAGNWTTGATSFGINPGVSTTFPWLSRLAPNFEEYRFRKLRFVYVPRCATATNGAIYTGIDYDSSDAAPQSISELMSFKGSSQSPIWSELALALNQADASFLKKRFVRSGALVSGVDVTLYDVGRAYIVGLELGGLETCGDIYVEYDVELFTPQFSIAAFAQQNSAKVNSGGTVTPTSIYGSAPALQAGSGLPVVASAGGTLTFSRVGQYLLDLFMSGTTMTSNPLTITGTAVASSLLSSLINTATSKSSQFKVRVTEPGQTVQLLDDAATVTSTAARVTPYFEELS